MKCPHCKYTADESKKLRCTQCGQIFDRAYFNEFQNLEYLQDWIQQNKENLGSQAETLLAKVESRLIEVRQHLGIQIRPAEQVAMELALTQGALSKVTSWRKAVDSRFAATQELNKHLDQQIHYLRAELGERSSKLDAPTYLEVIDFTLNSTQAWKKAGYLSNDLAPSLIRHLQNERSARVRILAEKLAQQQAIIGLIPDWTKLGVISATFSESLKTHLSNRVKDIESELGEHPEEVMTPLGMIQFALQALPGWAENPNIICQKDEVRNLHNHLIDQRRTIEKAIAGKAEEADRKPVYKPEPPEPPKEHVPFDQWLLSERNIKIALYAGGLLLVIAGLIFIGVNWTRIPGPAKFAITVMVTGLMYLGGFLLFQRPAYRIGGVALLGVASGFLTLNFGVLQLYVLGPAGFRDDVMWLMASLFCLLLYILTAYWTKSALFTYISLLAAGSSMFATLVVLEAPESAYLLAFSIAGLLLLILAHRLKKTSLADFTYLPLMIVSHGLVVLTFIDGLFVTLTQSGLTSLPTGSPWLAHPVLVIGLAFCLLNAYWKNHVLYIYASVLLIAMIAPSTLYFLSYSFDIQVYLMAYILTFAILAIAFLISARFPRKFGWSDVTQQILLIAAQLLMPVVTFLSILGWVASLYFGETVEGWISLVCMGLSVTFYILTDVLFKKIVARWVAALLLPVALGITMLQLEFADSAIGIAMMVLALAYLGVGYLLVRREMLPKSGWPLYATAYILASLVTLLAIPDQEDLAKILFADVLIVVVSAAVHRSYWWVYGAVWLFMLPVYLVIDLNVSAIHQQGLLMGLLGLNYAVIGYFLGRRDLRFGGPFLTAAAFLSVITVLMTWTDPLTASLVLAVDAILYLAAALWLDWTWLLYPSLLGVNLLMISTNAYIFDFREPYDSVLIISVGTLGLFLAIGGLVLRRLEQSHWSWPLYLVAVIDLCFAYASSLLFGGWMAILISGALAVLLLAFSWWERTLISNTIKIPLLTYLGLGVIFIAQLFLPSHLSNIIWYELIAVSSAGVCFLFVLISWFLREESLSKIYGVPLRYSGLGLMAVSIAFLMVNFEIINVAITLGIAGFTVALDGTIRHNRMLSYGSIVLFVLVSIAMLFVGSNIAASLTILAISGLYLFMALWLKSPWLLLPSLFALYLVLYPFASIFIEHTQTLVYTLIISSAVLGLILAIGGRMLRRRTREGWAWPFYIVSFFSLASAYLASLVVGGWLAVALSILAALLMFSYAWLEREVVENRIKFALLSYLGIGVIFIGHFYILEIGFDSLMWDVWPAFTAGLCMLFAVAGLLLRQDTLDRIYGTPLRYSGLSLMAIPILGSLYVFINTLNAIQVAVTFAIGGLTYAINGAYRRNLYLVLISVGSFLVMIWATLWVFEISEPQAYIIPLGLILVVGGWFVRDHDQNRLYQLSTLSGLLLLMGSAFAQSVITGAFGYAILLAVESILSLAWGINSRCRCYVQVGGLALIANAVFQLGPGLIDLPRWIQIGLTGAILLGGGLVALFKREEIISTRQKMTDGWRQWNP